MMKREISAFIAGAVLFGTAGVFAGQYVATDNPFPIQLNGENVSMEGYNIEGSTYFKLRDIADVLGGFEVGFGNNTIQLSQNGYVYDNTPQTVNMLNSMTDDEKYMINIFLSNFSELSFFDFDASNINRDQLIYFGCLHNSRNHTAAAIAISDEEAAKYVSLDDNIHACYKVDKDTVANSVDRYFGLPVEHGTAAYDPWSNSWSYPWNFGYSNGYYYFDSGEEGAIIIEFSIAENMRDNGDGTYTVDFTNYYSGYSEMRDVCYNLTPDSVKSYGSKVIREESGTAVVRPHNYNGKNTYQLVSWHAEKN